MRTLLCLLIAFFLINVTLHIKLNSRFMQAVAADTNDTSDAADDEADTADTADAADDEDQIPKIISISTNTSDFGAFLVSDGEPLYVFSLDTNRNITCLDDCAEEWPAVVLDNNNLDSITVDS